jgi:PAS domain S-box-containing protein
MYDLGVRSCASASRNDGRVRGSKIVSPVAQSATDHGIALEMSDAVERRLASAVSPFVGAAGASNDAGSGMDAPRNRLVQFYQSEAFLSETVGRFVVEGLVDGEFVFAVATHAHRRMLCEHLRNSGFDVPRLQQLGRLALFDAREVLDAFMCDGQPDAQLFQSALGTLMAEHARDRPGVRIRAYAEMADLLWKDGNTSAAMRVEELWNEVGRSYPLTLLCSYALADSGDAEVDPRLEPARKRGYVLPTERELLSAPTARKPGSAQAEERLRLFVECVKDYAIFMLDPWGYVASWNVGAHRIKGYSEQEIIGKHFSIFYPKEAVESGKCELELEIAARDGRFEDEGWRIRKDGSAFWANVVITAIHDRQGRLVGYGKVTRDLTARRTAERESVQRARAEEGERRKEDFLAILGHELRNPLAPMMTAMHIIKERGCVTCEREIAVLDRQLSQLARLLDDLNDVARTLQGKLVMSPRVVDLRTVLRDAVEQAAPDVAEHRHRFDVELPEAAVVVRVDPDRMRQVFVNLLNNAAKYTPDGGHVRLRAEQRGDGVLVSVEDDGIGITKDFLERLFDPFSQARQSDERQLGGLGVGLAVAQRLVHEHGGRIEAASEGPRHGSRFTVRLPISASVPPTTADAEPSAAVRTRRILVIDDNVDHALMLGVLLSDLGHQVATAHDGVQGLKLALDFKPDLVFLDLGLPGLSGFEVCRRLRQLPEFVQVPIVAVTGYARASDRKRALEAGFTDHVAKPFDIARVVETVYGSTTP